MNLCRALILALDTKFEFLRKHLLRVLNLNLLRAGQLQRRCSDRKSCFLFATYPAIVRLVSVPDPRQRPNLAVSRDKTDNMWILAGILKRKHRIQDLGILSDSQSEAIQRLLIGSDRKIFSFSYFVLFEMSWSLKNGLSPVHYLLPGPAIDLQKMPILTKKSSFQMKLILILAGM